jgi:hypothetical protein
MDCRKMDDGNGRTIGLRGGDVVEDNKLHQVTMAGSFTDLVMKDASRPSQNVARTDSRTNGLANGDAVAYDAQRQEVIDIFGKVLRRGYGPTRSGQITEEARPQEVRKASVKLRKAKPTGDLAADVRNLFVCGNTSGASIPDEVEQQTRIQRKVGELTPEEKKQQNSLRQKAAAQRRKAERPKAQRVGCLPRKVAVVKPVPIWVQEPVVVEEDPKLPFEVTCPLHDAATHYWTLFWAHPFEKTNAEKAREWIEVAPGHWKREHTVQDPAKDQSDIIEQIARWDTDNQVRKHHVSQSQNFL